MALKGELTCMLLIIGVATHGKNVDELGVFFGLQSPDAQTVSTTVVPKSEWNFESEVRIYVDTSADVVVLTCEVALPSKQHSLHLLCPLMQETRLCFENCKRVCSLPDCSDSPELFSVDCVEDVFVRDKYNIWKFRYIINRYNAAIDGAWSCFHAGKETQTVNVTSVRATSPPPPSALSPLNLPHVWPFTQSSDGQLGKDGGAEGHETKDLTGHLEAEEDSANNSSSSLMSQGAWSNNGTLFSQLLQGSGNALRTVILTLVAFLVTSILINVLSVLMFLLKRSASKDDSTRKQLPLNLSTHPQTGTLQSRPAIPGRSNGFVNAATNPMEAKPNPSEPNYSRNSQQEHESHRGVSRALVHCLPCYHSTVVSKAGASAFRLVQDQTPKRPATAAAVVCQQNYPPSVELRPLHSVVSTAAAGRGILPVASTGTAIVQTVPVRRPKQTSEATAGRDHGSIPLAYRAPVSAFTDLQHEPTAAVLARNEIPQTGGLPVRSTVMQPTPRVVHPLGSGQPSCHATILRPSETLRRLPESHSYDQHIFINHSQRTGLTGSGIRPSQVSLPAGQLNGPVENASDPGLERMTASVFNPPAEWRDTSQVQLRPHPPPGTILIQVPPSQGHCSGEEEPVTSSGYLIIQNVSASTYVPLVTVTDKTRSQYADGSSACIAVNSAVLSNECDQAWPRESQRLVRSPSQSHSSSSSADTDASSSDLTSFV